MTSQSLTQEQESEGNNKVFKELLIDELKDLYNAENQLTKALPKMAKAAKGQKLKEAIEEHLEQTEGHVQRLEEAFERLGEKARGKTCMGMKGLIEEGKEHITEKKDSDEQVADLALIAAAQKVEHYEISAYGTVRTIAETLGESEVADLLRQTEDEEKKADELLTEIAKSLLEGA